MFHARTWVTRATRARAVGDPSDAGHPESGRRAEGSLYFPGQHGGFQRENEELRARAGRWRACCAWCPKGGHVDTKHNGNLAIKSACAKVSFSFQRDIVICPLRRCRKLLSVRAGDPGVAGRPKYGQRARPEFFGSNMATFPLCWNTELPARARAAGAPAARRGARCALRRAMAVC